MSLIHYSTSDIEALCSRLKDSYAKKVLEGGRRLIVSLAGVPGSGKSTLASALVAKLGGSLRLATLPQDGFHYTREYLLSFDNVEEAFARRGAPFTFDSAGFLQKIKTLHASKTIYAPSFDHRLKDPVENGVVIPQDTQVVLVEGNYVSLNEPVWKEIKDHVDESWFISIPLDLVRNRVIVRHLSSGVCKTQLEAEIRTDSNDLVNARYILENSAPTTVVIDEALS